MGTAHSKTSSIVESRGEEEPLGLELAREMRRRWRRGERPAAEEFLAAHPELAVRPEAAVDLIYEEFCLRQAAGDENAQQDLLARFPQWSGALRVMLDCHRRLLVEADRDEPAFPEVGEVVGEFKLLAELGRGAQGRVFIARQTALADRPVVLKITALEDGGEHLSLARLQHTNIVPLYSVIDEAARGIRILCMPYFGRATLASLLESLAKIPFADRTGLHIVEFLDRMQELSSPASAPTSSSAARQMLAHVSFVQAMCWISATLADALQFAHERGVVHLDLKPSNVLLAGDGQPMLLDFHLAREPIEPHGAMPDNLGGTPPYMAPEQKSAMQALHSGHSVDLAVDRRADIHALGAMLNEALGGIPHVSTGLGDIIAKCTAIDPRDRYANAAELADDLRRHLTDQPLAGVPNRSTRERWQKWRRRRPRMLRAAAMLTLMVSSAVICVAAAMWYVHDRRQQIEVALRDGQRQLQTDGQAGEAVQTLRRGLDVAHGVPLGLGVGALKRELNEQLAVATRLHLTSQIHQLAEDIRAIGGSDAIPPARLAPLAEQCDTLWQKRNATRRTAAAGNHKADGQLADNMLDIAVFAAGMHASSDPAKAMRLLDEAETEFGPSALLAFERQRLAPHASLTATAPAPPPRTAWEHCVLGRACLRSGDLARASSELRAAVALDPAGRWPNFYCGICASRLGGHSDAVACFSVAIGTAPNSASFYYHRSLAYAALGQSDRAARDYDCAVQLDPSFVTKVTVSRGGIVSELTDRQRTRPTRELPQ